MFEHFRSPLLSNKAFLHSSIPIKYLPLLMLKSIASRPENWFLQSKRYCMSEDLILIRFLQSWNILIRNLRDIRPKNSQAVLVMFSQLAA